MADDLPVLPIPESQRKRYENLKDKFMEVYGEAPTFFARAPGRVNLIGEHIDYCGYSVLPMAIDQDVVMAVAPDSEGRIELCNTDEKYEKFSGRVDENLLNFDKPVWYKYVLCGVVGIKEKFCSLVTYGFKALVDGSIPPSAGLSSSSALVCCSAMTMLKANQWPMSKTDIAETCAHCERYIGTQGGGMDQAISFTASAGMAKLIDFNPLRTTDVKLPPGANFVVGNSLAEMNKAATPHYNIRVVECHLGAQIMAANSELDWKTIKTLGGLQTSLKATLDEMMKKVESILHPEPYTKEEVCSLLKVSPKELECTSLSPNTLHVESFKLYQRAQHVYSEAARVKAFIAVCDEQPPNALEQLGKIMDASHDSCKNLYECSHPDLDSLVELSRKSGALGSRMTGAGWGGCTVSIARTEDVDKLLSGLKTGYYDADPKKSAVVQEALFRTSPANGAAYYEPS